MTAQKHEVSPGGFGAERANRTCLHKSRSAMLHPREAHAQDDSVSTSYHAETGVRGVSPWWKV